MHRKSFLKLLGVGVAAAAMPAPILGALNSPPLPAPIAEPLSIAPELKELTEANLSPYDVFRRLVVIDKDGKPGLRVKIAEK